MIEMSQREYMMLCELVDEIGTSEMGLAIFNGSTVRELSNIEHNLIMDILGEYVKGGTDGGC